MKTKTITVDGADGYFVKLSDFLYGYTGLGLQDLIKVLKARPPVTSENFLEEEEFYKQSWRVALIFSMVYQAGLQSAPSYSMAATPNHRWALMRCYEILLVDMGGYLKHTRGAKVQLEELDTCLASLRSVVASLKIFEDNSTLVGTEEFHWKMFEDWGFWAIGTGGQDFAPVDTVKDIKKILKALTGPDPTGTKL